MTRRRPREATMGIGMVRRSIARARLRRAITVLSSTAMEGRPPTDRAPSHRVSANSIQVSTGERPGDTAPRAWATQTLTWARVRSSEGRDSNPRRFAPL